MKRWGYLLLLWGQAALAACPPLLNYKVPGLMGGEINLCQYAEQPVLVVNTASHCGFTPQFTQLESLYKQYGPRGLVVIGFPSNDFFQELDQPSEIGAFCQANYGVTFPMAGKGHVRAATRSLSSSVDRRHRRRAGVEFPQVPDPAGREQGGEHLHPHETGRAGSGGRFSALSEAAGRSCAALRPRSRGRSAAKTPRIAAFFMKS